MQIEGQLGEEESRQPSPGQQVSPKKTRRIGNHQVAITNREVQFRGCIGRSAYPRANARFLAPIRGDHKGVSLQALQCTGNAITGARDKHASSGVIKSELDEVIRPAPCFSILRPRLGKPNSWLS